MYSVYKITNLINNKCYIGSSIRVNKRWKEHLNCSKNSNDPKYDYPLYCAFRKYGIENFHFEILRDDFDSVEEMQSYEKEMIIFFDSYNNGYNQTYNTDTPSLGSENLQKYIQQISQKCAKVKNGKIIEVYNSYHEAARKNGYDGDFQASSIRKVCKGQQRNFNGDIFQDLDKNNNLVIPKYLTSLRHQKIFCVNVETLEEKYYDSVSQASRELNIDRNRIQQCSSGNQRYSIVHNYIFRKIDEDGNIIEIENAPTVEEKIFQYNESNPLINGERHSIKEWCNIYNITTSSYYQRRKKGMGVIEAIITPKKR